MKNVPVESILLAAADAAEVHDKDSFEDMILSQVIKELTPADMRELFGALRALRGFQDRLFRRAVTSPKLTAMSSIMDTAGEA
ncbi:hypothetical protein [Allosphingosinicella humi]